MRKISKKEMAGHGILGLAITLVFIVYILFLYMSQFQSFIHTETQLCSRLGGTVDDIFANTEAISSYVTFLPSVAEITSDEEKASILEYKEVQDNMRKLVSSNPLYQSFYIYFINNGTVLTDYNKYFIDEFPDYALIERILSQEDPFIWYHAGYLNTDHKYVISLIRHFPIGSSAPSAVIIVNLRQDILMNAVRDELKGQRFQIVQNGVVIADSDTDTPGETIEFVPEAGVNWKRNGLSYQFFVPSADGKFTYLYTVSSSQFLTPFWQRLRTVFAAYLLFLLLGAVVFQIILRTQKRNYALLLRKIGTYLTNLSDTPKEANSFSTLSFAIDSMLLKNQQTELALEYYSPIIRDHYIMELLLGSSDLTHSSGEFDHMTPAFPYPAFLCLVCDVFNSDDPEDAQSCNQILLYVKKVTEERLSQFCCIYGTPLLSERLAFILNYPPDFPISKELKNAVEELTAKFRREMNSIVLFASGSREDTKEGISHSYLEASRNLSGKFLSDIHLVMPHDFDGNNSANLLSFQHAAVVALLESSMEEVSKKLQIFFTYLQSKTFSMEKKQYIGILYLSGIWNELTARNRGISTSLLVSAVKELLETKDMEELLHIMTRALEGIYEEVNNTEALKSPEGSHYITQVVQFINGHYHENISIADIASCVHLNPRYLGKLFKDATNYTLTEYLNRTRIKHSKELLATGKYTIQKVSELSGYADIRAYIRFFKKFEGCTPGEFNKARNK